MIQLTHTLAERIGHFLERQGLLERDEENSYLSEDVLDEDPMNTLLGHSVAYRIAVGPHTGRKVFTLQTLSPSDEPGTDKVAGFSLHAGVVARANEREKLERLCRYITRPALSEKRLSLTDTGQVRRDAKRGKGRKTSATDELTDPATQCHAAMTWAQRLKRVFGIDIATWHCSPGT